MDRLPIGGIPDMDRIGGIAARQQPTIRTESQHVHLVGMAVEQNDRFPGIRVPDARRRVPTS